MHVLTLERYDSENGLIRKAHAQLYRQVYML